MPASPSRPPPASRPPWPQRPLLWLRELMRRPLVLERRGLQIHVLLGPTQAAAVPVPPPNSGEALRAGHAELCALLGRHPEVRHLMRHLGFVEQAIARHGSRALRREVPVPVLRKALQQLELLLRDEPSATLEELRGRIEQAVARRERPGDDEAVADGAVQVSEASHSLFDEMERSWTGQMPLPEATSERPELAPPAARA